jgi:hypothetical protein
MRLKQKRRKLLVWKYFLGFFIDFFINLMQSQVLVLLNLVQGQSIKDEGLARN